MWSHPAPMPILEGAALVVAESGGVRCGSLMVMMKESATAQQGDISGACSLKADGDGRRPRAPAIPPAAQTHAKLTKHDGDLAKNQQKERERIANRPARSSRGAGADDLR